MAQVKKTAPAAKATARPAPKSSSASKAACTPEQRFRMIQEAAYYRAEKAGFAGEGMQYWLEAEKDIDRKLKAR